MKAWAWILFAFLSVPGEAAVSISISTAAPQSLWGDLLETVTSQYQTTVTKSSFFPNTWAIVISSKNPVQATHDPIIPDDYAAGFADGMDSERWQDMNLINNLMVNERYKSTCGGYDIYLSTDSVFNSCQQIYRNLISNIGERWMDIFSSTGAIITP